MDISIAQNILVLKTAPWLKVMWARVRKYKKMLLTYKDNNFVSFLFSFNIFLTEHNSDR